MKRRFAKVDIQEILNLDEKKRNITFDLQELQNKRNNYSKSIALIKDNKERGEKIITKVNEIKEKMKNNEEHLVKVSNKLQLILLSLPNNASSEVPIGKDDTFIS